MQPSHHHAQPSALTDRADDESAALATFERNSAAFRALDPRGVAAFYQQLARFLSPRGDFTLTSAVRVEHVYARVMCFAAETGRGGSPWRASARHEAHTRSEIERGSEGEHAGEAERTDGVRGRHGVR
jgi:hypothetical protein